MLFKIEKTRKKSLLTTLFAGHSNSMDEQTLIFNQDNIEYITFDVNNKKVFSYNQIEQLEFYVKKEVKAAAQYGPYTAYTMHMRFYLADTQVINVNFIHVYDELPKVYDICRSKGVKIIDTLDVKTLIDENTKVAFDEVLKNKYEATYSK